MSGSFCKTILKAIFLADVNWLFVITKSYVKINFKEIIIIIIIIIILTRTTTVIIIIIIITIIMITIF